MALRQDADGFLQGDPVDVDRGFYDRAIVIWREIKDNTDEIRKALQGGVVAIPGGKAEPAGNGTSQKESAGATEEKGAATPKDGSGANVPDSARPAKKAAEPGSRNSSPVPPQNRARSEKAQAAKRDDKGRFADDAKSDGGNDRGGRGGNGEIVGAIKDGFAQAGDNIEELDPVIKAAQETKSLATNVIGIGKATGAVFKGIWSGTKRGFGLMRALFTVMRGGGDKQIPWLKRIWREMKRGNEQSSHHDSSGWLSGGIGGAIGAIVEKLGAAILPALGMILSSALKVGLVALAWEGGKAIGNWLYEKFGDNIVNAMEDAADFIKSSWGKVASGWDAVVSLASGVIEGVANKYKAAKNAVIGGATTAMETAANWASSGVEWTKGKLGMRRKVQFGGFAGADSMSRYGSYTDEEAAQIVDMKKRGVNTSARIGGMPADVQKKITDAAIANGIDPALMVKIASMESGGNVNAVSSTGASGLFQLTGQTASGLGVKNRFNADQNIAGAMSLTKQNMNMLQKAGLPLTPENIYMLHQLGPTGLEVIKGAQSGLTVAQLSPAAQKAMGMNVGNGSMTAAGYIAQNAKALDAAGRRAATPVANVPASASAAPSIASGGPAAAPKVVAPITSGKGGQSSTTVIHAPIGQNVNDRGIAQVATGGMGGQR